MKELFNQHSLGLGIKEYKFESKNLHTQIFTRWNNLLQNSFKKEEQLQTDFLNDIFGEVLGYIYKRGEAESNLEKEEKTELDGQKPDGILGFFSGKAKDVRVIIELKDQKTNLDKSQNRATDKRSPIEQAFGYVAKYQGIEWVIASNFKEIRLYKANYAGKYHSFTIEELANDNNKIKEFHFLLAKNRLFTKTPNQSPVHSLNTAEKGEEIEKKFYKHYSTLREEIWHNLLELNMGKHYGRNFYLYKAQKLIDRIVFIRFCKENGALDNDAVLEALNNKYIKGKYSRMKALFTAIDEGNPEIGIAKFNGGLFAEDKDLDSLEISDEIIDKIVILYSYNFGSDLDVNILGHIFEQSISDLENLTGDNEKKRKKDGVFYTPAYITEYIVKEAIGGWLADRKAEIGFTCPRVGEGEAKSRALCKKEKGEKEKWQAYAESLKSIKILDPACGSGAFLVKVFDYLQKEWQEVEKNLQIWHIKTDWTYQDILTHNIYGVDINPASVGITKLSLWLKTAHYREPLTTLDYNIKIGNSLIDNPDIAGYYSEFEGKIVSEIIQRQGELLNEGQDEFKKDKQDIDYYFKKSLAFKWEEEFPRVFKPETNSINLYQSEDRSDSLHSATRGFNPLSSLTVGPNEIENKITDGRISPLTRPDKGLKPLVADRKGFDVVVGNPPYVSAVTMKLSQEARNYYINRFQYVEGAFDLYLLFLLQAKKILNDNGKFGWIIPNKLLQSNYSQKALEYLTNNNLCNSYNVSSLNIFEGVSVYPIIFCGHTGKGLKKYNILNFEPFQLQEEINTLQEYKTFKDFNIKIECGAAGFEAGNIAQNILETRQENYIPFVVSGSIDPYCIDYCNVQYMKKNYRNAFVNINCVSENRKKLWMNEKIIIAGMTKRVEATYFKEPIGVRCRMLCNI